MHWKGQWADYFTSDISISADATSDVIKEVSGKNIYITGIGFTADSQGKVTIKSSDTAAITGPIYVLTRGGGLEAHRDIPAYLFKTAEGEPFTITTSDCAIGGWVEGWKE